MSSPFERTPDFPDDFSGGFSEDFPEIVRLFPLPNVVLFPHVLLPLHIFEPRYLEMVEDALEGDRLIAIAQLQPGWEIPDGQSSDNDSLMELQPKKIFPIVCVGHIAHHVRLQNGHFNLVLQGTQRARIITELPFERSFRRAQVEILKDIRDVDHETQEDGLRTELLKGFRRLFPKLDVEHDLNHVFESDIPLGILCDVFAYSLQLDSLVSQQLLAEPNVEHRSRQLLILMEQELAKKPVVIPREFPPQFSLN